MLKSAFRFLGSVYFAVALIGGLAAILTVSTLLESAYGTPFVQRFFYTAGWFDVFLGLIALNMLIALLRRIPLRRHHTGFAVTHVGALALLAGSLLSRLYGVEGQMMLFESEKNDAILQQTYEIMVHRHDGAAARFDLADLPGRPERDLEKIAPGLRMRLVRVLENAQDSVEIREAPAGAPANAAVRLRLKGETAGFDDAFWLVEKDPMDPHASSKAFGPARFELKRVPNPGAAPEPKKEEAEKRPEPQTASVDISVPGVPAVSVPLDKPAPAEIPLGPYRITGFTYYPDARVGEGNKLVTAGEEPNNPAVRFDLVDAEGKTVPVVHFALFPEFRSMHGQSDQGPAVDVKFSLPEGHGHEGHGHGEAGGGMGGARFVVETDGKRWAYRSSSKTGEQAGELREGQPVATGWMDFEILPEKLLPRAEVKRDVTAAPGKGFTAAELAFLKDGREIWRGWAVEGEAVQLPPEAGDTMAILASKTVPVPFELTLKDFRKVDYPGTQNAMSYESDVVLTDPEDGTQIHKTIKMNEPLDYKGYRIFQSSFIQNETHGEASVFTIAKNPGITLIYGGSVVLFIGVFLVFFVPQFSPWRVR